MVRWFVDRSPQRGIPSVSLRRLLPEARFVGCRDWEVSGCSADSRRLEPGQVFVAVSGPGHDGHEFVAQAIERGAAGVVVERLCPEAGRLQVVVPDSRLALARIGHALAGDPSRSLRLIGVAGGTGKTVTSLFVRAIFEAAGARFGLVSPLGWSDGTATHPAGQAPPSADTMATMLAAMVERGCAGGVVQVADEAIEQRSLEGIAFDTVVITNLVGSGPLEPDAILHARRSRAARLLRMVVPGGVSAVNADDPQVELLGGVNLDSRRVSFAIGWPADVSAKIDRMGPSGSLFRLRGFDREAKVELRLVGSENVRNAIAAAAVARARGLATDAVVAGLESVARVPGRLEPVHEGQPFDVRIDRTRTAAELRDALTALRELGAAAIHCVLGAEGLRDRSLRQGLAQAAEEGADRVILTTDNPRTEDPAQIIADLLGGFRKPARVRVEPDRRSAIEAALAAAAPGDGVLIAGKGHETFQIFADRAIAFNDRAVAVEWLRNHRPMPQRSTG
jgi:UDP-N-acetylmuramoyl-L-alanyl-D-glutamate--2,6-diaminopimelate ligase